MDDFTVEDILNKPNTLGRNIADLERPGGIIERNSQAVLTVIEKIGMDDLERVLLLTAIANLEEARYNLGHNHGSQQSLETIKEMIPEIRSEIIKGIIAEYEEENGDIDLDS